MHLFLHYINRKAPIVPGIVVCMIMLVCSIPAHGQRGSYLSLGGGLGLTGFKYHIDGSTTSNRFGFFQGLGYSYFFTPRWGVGTGVYWAQYKSYGRLDTYQAQFEGKIDDEGDLHTKIVDLQQWEERQRGKFIELPLLLQYQKHNGRRGFYAALGTKVQFRRGSDYKVTDGMVSISGYYPKWNVLLYGLPQHGFGTSDWEQSGNMQVKTSYTVVAQIGAIFALAPHIDLILGGYLDAGVNNIKQGNGSNLLEMPGNEPVYTDMVTANETGQVRLLSYGALVMIRFGLGGSTGSYRKRGPVKCKFPKNVGTGYSSYF